MRIRHTQDSSSPTATSTCRLGLLAAALIAAASACDPAPATPTATRPATAAARPTETATRPATSTVHPTETATPPQPTVTVTVLLPDTLYLTQTPEPLVPAGCVEAQVVEVVDGDTINVRIDDQEYAVRYIGIDAPETRHSEKAVEWMAPQAARANEDLVGGKTVYLEKDVSETDQYGRLLRYVYLADGTFVNEEMVRRGYAQSSTYRPDVKYQDLF